MIWIVGCNWTMATCRVGNNKRYADYAGEISRKHRELLRAIVAVRLGISFYKKVNLKALDAAYSIAFPKSTPINVNKKKKCNK